ncbi:MAG: insulinase family protein [Chlorobi bacterium]|nr:insulinase family protein [Chlorobiota bacterium]
MTPSLVELPNRLRVVVLRKDGPPLVSIGVAYRVGSADETPDKTGYAHLFEHLMFDNIARVDGKSFDEIVTDAGGSSNAYTMFDWTYYHMTLPLQAWQLGLELEAERMSGFTISQRALDVQRNVVIEEIAENVFNQPYGTARMLLAQAAFSPDGCYAWDIYGSIEHLRSMTLDDARSWYERYYRPDNAVLAVVGAFDSTAEIVEFIVERFASLPTSSPHNNGSCRCIPRNERLIERDTSLPADMLICAYHFPGIEDQHTCAVAEILAAVLSAGRSSPVARQFVYDQQLAHNAATSADIRVRGSLMEFSALARTKSVTAEQLYDQWQNLLAATFDSPLDPIHLERTRNKIRRRYAQAFQTTEGLAEMLALATMLFDDPERPWRELDMLLAVTDEEIHQLARSLFAGPPAVVQFSTSQ